MMAALAGPNTFAVTLPRHFKCNPTANVDRLKPDTSRSGRHSPCDPGRAPGAGFAGG